MKASTISSLLMATTTTAKSIELCKEKSMGGCDYYDSSWSCDYIDDVVGIPDAKIRSGSVRFFGYCNLYSGENCDGISFRLDTRGLEAMPFAPKSIIC
ncbi:hypothetical protein CDD80_1696 [Ophiocordyceps camponoti-rufipedis]|uniref:Uncharacterized protein n=1 Tax=Ophiocordyceps camponoti-rufipedis TaxID=2004952 RepID=A0A2C5Z5F5_9HYPO|nr:hypothetical protein CDD80_1696 [Ophiocordyceps camponoti-rufipedis]